ncbi:MAG: DinB family protein [Holophagaceae bacterium]
MDAVRCLVETLERAYRRKSWHGTGLRGSLRLLYPEARLWRPGPGRPSAWELLVHAAYWKYIVLKALEPAAGHAFGERGSNFFPREDGLSEADWKEDLARLDALHLKVLQAAGRLRPADLDRPAPGRKDSAFTLLAGLAAHDLHHAGQVQLIRRLWEAAPEG